MDSQFTGSFHGMDGVHIAGLVNYFLDGTQWARVLVIHYVFLKIYEKSISYCII